VPWLLIVAVIALAVVWWRGRREYPPATSLEAYTLMEALYTACNTKNADSLTKTEDWVNKAFSEGKLGQAEKDAFGRIIGMAKSGEWRAATKAAYKFSLDQVGQGRVFPKSANQGRDDDSAKQ
jgi:hypothetical protein